MKGRDTMGKIRIRELEHGPSPEQQATFAQIAQAYYPPQLRMAERIAEHISEGAHARVAEQDGHILGFALSSCRHRQTPFHAHPVPGIYQRQLFVAPDQRGRHLGIRLQIATFRHHLGPFWLLRRFFVYCLTHNPLVVRNYRYFSRYYPRLDDGPVPDPVQAFAEKLLPEVSGQSVDDRLRIHGSFKSVLEGVDYTFWWKTCLETGEARVDRRVLDWLYRRENGRIVHSGLSLLMLGYAEPMQFVKRYAELRWRRRRSE